MSNVITEDMKRSMQDATDLKIEDNQIIDLEGKIVFTGQSEDECMLWIRGYTKGYLDSLKYAIDNLKS